MKILNKFLPKKKIEKKGFNATNYFDYISGNCFHSFLQEKEYYDLAAYQAIKYYCMCAPLATAIDWISSEVADLEPKIWDKKNKEFSTEHEVLNLLQWPNADSTLEEFIFKCAAFFLLSGNNYILATGDVTKPPLELYIIPPQSVTIDAGEVFADIINVYMMKGNSIRFYRNEILGRLRYYTQNKEQEIFQIKNFNPASSTDIVYGKSILNSVYYEIEQYIQASIHNLSLLKRGARLSGIFKTDNQLNPEQFTRLQSQIDKYFSGAENAGRPALLESGLNWQEMGLSNKDMDFMALKKEVTTTIYKRLKIPLPMISEDTMTMANMETAKLNFYDNAIIPLANRIYAELTNFLIPRYEKDSNLEISFDIGEIPALEPRRNAQLMLKKELNIFTINELRAETGAEPLEGGDDLYGSVGEVPIASKEEDNNKSLREKYIRLMQAQQNRFTELTNDDINNIATTHGL